MSRIDLPEENRSTLCELLGVAYACTVDLASQVQQARWTMQGAVATRELLEEVRDGTASCGDRLLLRIAALGGSPRTTLKGLAKQSILPDYDVTATSAGEHVEALADRFELLAATLRRDVEMATSLEDPITAHVFAAVCEQVEASMARLERSIGAG